MVAAASQGKQARTVMETRRDESLNERRTGRRALWSVAAVACLAMLVIGGTGAERGSAGAQPLAAAPTATPAAMAGMSHGLTSPNRRPVRQQLGSRQVLLLPPSGRSPSWNDLVQIYRRLSAAWQATIPYASERNALHDGYRRMPGLQAQMYATLTNVRNAVRTARAFDPRKPTSLVYMEMGGATGLSAVSYTLPSSTTARQLDAIFPASMAQWSENLNVCQAAGKKLSATDAASIHTRSACTARGGHFVPAAGWTITAWIWQTSMGMFEPHPTGMSDMNPGSANRQVVDMTQEPYQMQMLMTTGKPPSWADISKVYTLLSKARAATQKYRNLAVAKRAGFITAPFLFVPGQGAHYVSPQAIADGLTGRAMHFSITKPPVLVYNQEGGKMKLSSLLYLMPDSATPQQLSAIFPASMAVWHRHINNCVIGSKVVPIHDRATCEQGHGLFLATTGWMVHAWLWEKSVGVFDMDK